MERLFPLLLAVYGGFMILGILLQQILIFKKIESIHNWRKFLVFNLIMLGIIICLELVSYSAIILFSIITLGGVIEIVNIIRKSTISLNFLGILIYLPLFCFFLYGSFVLPNSVLISSLVLVAVFDGFSQLGGKLIGKRKLAPKISPNKTWEGLGIGALACLSCGFILTSLNVLHNFLLILVIPVLALAGDLIASLIKRRANIKDFSKAIPYQGGFIDRFDSYVFTISMFTLILSINIILNY